MERGEEDEEVEEENMVNVEMKENQKEGEKVWVEEEEEMVE